MKYTREQIDIFISQREGGGKKIVKVEINRTENWLDSR